MLVSQNIRCILAYIRAFLKMCNAYVDKHNKKRKRKKERQPEKPNDSKRKQEEN